jgi:5'(3')-deoxyribonucleotidase
MDGVVADFDSAVMQFSTNKEKLLNEKTRSEEIDNTCENNPFIFEVLPLIKDSKESIKMLSKHYSIYFLSTPMWMIPESYSSKRKWLERNFGKFAHKRLILTHRKDLNIGDYLIDDRLKNGSENFIGKLIHFGNGDFKDWKSVTDFLLKQIKHGKTIN